MTASYGRLNLALAVGSLLVILFARTLALTADGNGLLLPGGARLPELCLHKRLTGQPCPTCNVGRSLVLAAKGDLAASRARHPGGLLLAAWLVFHALTRVLLWLRPPPLRYWWLDLSLTAISILGASLAVLAVSGMPS